MLYTLAHIIRDRLPFLWEAAEAVNGWLFDVRYSAKLKTLQGVLERHWMDGLTIGRLGRDDAAVMEKFFLRQPEAAFEFFRPHKFDSKTLARLFSRPSFLAFKVVDGEDVVGYFFLRSFVMGKGYLGMMADSQCRGRGLGKTMALCAMDVCVHLGIRMLESVSKANQASLSSVSKVLDVKILKEMDGDYIYVEDFPKGTLNKD